MPDAMPAPLRATPRLSAIPASQNTAPVAEFRCLFTHDTRKKQKKWHDGYLKFHSFNSRVIVYDASRFTVGDTYYKDSNELHEGDELVLDKGVMVEVAEPVGITHTDLTPLFERKTKDSPQRNNAAGPPRPLHRPTVPASNPLRTASQPRHKSLNALLGTPRGPIGKAAPVRSPFEERMEKENQPVEERATKRQKTAHEKQVQQATSQPTLRGTTSKTASSLSARPMLHSNTIPRPQALPRGATVISLSSQPEDDNIPSDVTLPHTPSRPDAVAGPPVDASAPIRRQSPPQRIAQTTPRLPVGKVPVPSVKAQRTPWQRPPPSSPPVSASNRIENVDFAIQLPSDPPKEPSPDPPLPKPRPVEKRKTKTLKLSTGAKRGMLLCQSAPMRRRMSPDEQDPRTSDAVRKGVNVPLQRDHLGAEPQRTWSVVQDATGAADRNRADSGTTVGPSKDATTSVEGTERAPMELWDDLELAHGFMDQQLMVTPSPPHLHHRSTTSKSPTIAKPNIAKRASTKLSKSTKRANEKSTENLVPKAKKAKVAQSKDVVAKSAKKKKADKPEPPVTSPSPSPAAVSISEEAISPSRPAAPLEPTERPRPTSIPLSPSKLAALSTGGFRKKSKRAKACATVSNNPDPPPPPRPTTVALPPHPLRSSKNGPLMSTTELSALLQSGPKSMRLEDDPIDDSTQGDSNISPSKRSSEFRRSRSENDAPIPSTSNEWERRNLPNPSDTAKPDPAPGSGNAKPKAGGLAALVKRTDPRRKFVRTQSLNVDTPLANAGTKAPEVASPPPVDSDIGPWSSEAFDLFDWKPPGKEWKAEGSKMKLVDISDEEDGGIGKLVDGR